MTGRDLLSGSLRLIGALASGEVLTSASATDGLSALNAMLDSWSNNALLVPSRVRDELTLVNGTGSYTFGSGGTLNSARPLSISECLFKDEAQTPAIELPVRIMSLKEWSAVALKTLTSTIVTDVYYEPTYPLGTIYVYPTPTAAKKLVFYSRKPLAQLATIDDALSLPPGYERALKYNLAIDLAPEYGRAVPDTVAETARDSIADIKRTNIRPSYLQCDPSMRGGAGRFNILTGDSSR